MKEGQDRRTLDPKVANYIVLICMFSMVIMIIVVLGGIFYFRNKLIVDAPGIQRAQAQKGEAYYVMITNQKNTPFWNSVFEGASEAAEQAGVCVELLGTNLSEEYNREQLMQIAIASKVDGIIVEADDTRHMTRLIKQAEQAGIPVVTVLGDNTVGGRQSFVSVSSYNLGKEYGGQVCEIFRKKAFETMSALVLLDSNEMNANQNTILTAIREKIESEGLAEQIRLETETIDKESAFSAEESVRDIFLKKEELPDVIVCLDEQNTTCAYQAVIDYNKVGDVEILGYYESDTIRSAIEKKVVYATVTVDTKQMGAYCVEALDEYRLMGNVSDYYVVDTQLINEVTSSSGQEGGIADGTE